MPALLYSHDGGVATLTLDSAPQNRLVAGLTAELAAAIQDVADRSDTRVLLLNANGPDFSFGGDISAWTDLSGAEFSQALAQMLNLSNVFQDLPFPVVVAVQGYCGGGGFELALRGDVIIAADDACFCHSEASIGVFTFLGGVQRVAERVGRTRAMQWALTAERVGARDALSAGLVNQVCPRAELQRVALEWVDRFKDGATLAHAAHKRLLREWSNRGISGADALLAEMGGAILESQDVQGCLEEAVRAVKSGGSRPKFKFSGL